VTVVRSVLVGGSVVLLTVDVGFRIGDRHQLRMYSITHFSLADSILCNTKAISALSSRTMVIPCGSPDDGQRLRLSGRALADRIALAAKLFGIQEHFIKEVYGVLSITLL
jgi:hypothetical protein